MTQVGKRIKRITQRNEVGREAPMVITPSALRRLVRRIFGRGGRR